jgi:uncharacterized protein
MIKRPVVDNGIVADLIHDGSSQPRRAIVLLGGSEGGKTWSSIGVRRPVNQLISLGYTLLSLAYFKAPSLPPTLEDIPLEYFERAFAWLATQPEVRPAGIAIIGVSRGAEASLLLGSMNPNIKAVVALSPSSVVWAGIPKMGADMSADRKSDWSVGGKGLPFVPDGFTSWNYGTLIRTLLSGTMSKAYEKALQNENKVAQASIPIENIQGAILLMSGKSDKMWPATLMCEQMTSRLAARGFIHPYQHIAFDSGHQGYIQKKETWVPITNFLQANYPPQ